MKKQRFLLVLLLAFIAGISSGYAQCTPGPLSPNAGVEYTYTMTNPGTNPYFHWYITKSTDVFAGTKEIPGVLFTVNGSNYDVTTSVIDNIKITWTSAGIADAGPFYLVLRYSEDAGNPVCRVENLRVTEIKPINTFLLALDGGMYNGTTYEISNNANGCAAPVTGATVITTTPSTVTLTFGNNTLYYIATASGIQGDWYPQIRVPGLQTSQVYVSAEWNANMDGSGTWNTFGVTPNGSTQDLLSALPATASVDGTPILIRVVINNNNWQTLADQEITLALDGFLPPVPIVPATSISDITSPTVCTPLGEFGRSAIFTINKRPAPAGNPAYLGITP